VQKVILIKDIQKFGLVRKKYDKPASEAREIPPEIRKKNTV
jgi:hypothetical protein